MILYNMLTSKWEIPGYIREALSLLVQIQEKKDYQPTDITK